MEYRSYMEKQKKYYNWEWVDTCIEKIGESLEYYRDVRYVTGIPRGGLIPAVLISHRFGLTYISLEQAKILPKSEKKKVVVVDDISDTGRTLKDLDIHDFVTASLTYRQDSTYLPHVFGSTVNHKHWLVFPWENRNSKTVQDYLVK